MFPNAEITFYVNVIQLFQFRLLDESFKRTQRDRKVLWVVVNCSLLGFAVYAFVSAMSELDVSTVNVCLRVLKENNKSKYDSYCLRGVPLFDNVKKSEGIPFGKV